MKPVAFPSDPGARASIQSTVGQLFRRDLWGLAWLALVVRVVFLLLGLQTQDIMAVSMWANDSWIYGIVADYWRHGTPEGHQWMLITGPGYGALLALMQIVFGISYWPPVILNVAMGVAAPLVVYAIAMELVGRRSVALLSGIIVAVSWTGVSSSISQLTDQPFYTLHALAILLFIIGLKRDKARWFLAAGLVAGVATYIRAMGQVWPMVFLFVSGLYALMCTKPERWKTFGRSLWTALVLLVLVLGWSYYNYAHHGVFTFTSNGVRAAASYLAARALADHTPGLDTETAQRQIGLRIVADIDPDEPQEIAKYHGARREFLEVFRAHPGWVIEAFYYNVKENVQASNYQIVRQVPQWERLWNIMTRQTRDVFNEWIFFISLAGLVLLIRDRNHLAWILLGSTLAAFTLPLGFSFWQGSRLHYPAEMAWSILFAYAVIRWVGWLTPRVQAYRARRRAAPA